MKYFVVIALLIGYGDLAGKCVSSSNPRVEAKYIDGSQACPPGFYEM